MSSQDVSYLVDLTERQYPLELHKDFTIGRALSNTLTIEDLKISRTHCRLREVNGFWSVIDESINGIYVNDKRIRRNEPLVLSNGDIIKLADQVHFKFMEAKSSVASDMEICDIVDQIETEHQYNTRSVTAHKHEVATATTSTNINNVTLPIVSNKQSLVEVSGILNEQENVQQEVQKSSAEASSMPDVETELQCSICTELFVKAQTLNCSHTYCRTCIEEWKKKNKICPICRAQIKTVTPTIVLDNLINTIIQSSSDEIKQHRKTLVEEREKICVTKQPKPRGRQPRNQGTVTRSNTRRSVTEPVLISSDDTESDEDDGSLHHLFFSDSDDFMGDDDFDDYDVAYDNYVPGDPHAYYGGYGACFHCGARGHWANGCPLR